MPQDWNYGTTLGLCKHLLVGMPLKGFERYRLISTVISGLPVILAQSALAKQGRHQIQQFMEDEPKFSVRLSGNPNAIPEL